MRAPCAVLVVSLVAACAFQPGLAHACSCARGLLDIDPANSAIGVPRNRAISLKGGIDPDSLVLENLDGGPHGFELLAHQNKGACGSSWSIELIPTPALEPNAHYEIRGTKLPMEGTAVAFHEPFATRFSTSSELLPDPELAPPRAVAVVLETPANSSTSCGRFDGTGCFRVDDPTDIEVVMRDGDEILQKLPLQARETQFMIWRMPSCIDFVRRAPTGRRSAPLTFCGDDLRKLPGGGLRQCDADVFGGSLQPGESDPDDADPPEAPRPGVEGAAGGPATPPHADDRSPPMAAGDADRREYGCAAVPGRHDRSSLGGFALLGLLALAFRRRRSS